jgi:hypothetical protein
MKPIAVAAALALAACATGPAPSPAGGGAAVPMMVLGTWHFEGSQSDLISATTDSPLSPKRQRELDEAVAALAAFRPTAIVVERVTPAPDYADPGFAAFTPADLAANADERVQIAYRLAAMAGVSRVYGVDEQPAAGEPDYFPFGAVMEHAGATGEGEAFGAMMARVQALIGAETRRLAALPMRAALAEANAGPMSSAEFYYELLKFDGGERQPGAELNAYWFMRNAKIFAKIADIARPGDRIIVVYGAGHKHWLEHLARNTPGFERADPVDYLKAGGAQPKNARR